jgi:hypothetical protein
LKIERKKHGEYPFGEAFKKQNLSEKMSTLGGYKKRVSIYI